MSLDAILAWLNTPPPAVGGVDPGTAIVGPPTNPVLYILQWVAIVVALVGVLYYITSQEPQ